MKIPKESYQKKAYFIWSSKYCEYKYRGANNTGDRVGGRGVRPVPGIQPRCQGDPACPHLFSRTYKYANKILIQPKKLKTGTRQKTFVKGRVDILYLSPRRP